MTTLLMQLSQLFGQTAGRAGRERDAPGTPAAALGNVAVGAGGAGPIAPPAAPALPAQVPWAITARWTDTPPGGTGTFVSLYATWVKDNVGSFNGEQYLCNWFPLRMLVEFAAAHGLRVRLDRWPGSAPTDGGERRWDTTRTLTYDSHGGAFGSKSAFYTAVKSRVTARMIGVLNTVAVARADATTGDLLIHELSDEYWHAELVVAATAAELVAQSGHTPAKVPRDRQKTFAALPSTLYGDAVRRWDFAQFEV